ncbi:hypothetical protein vseg_020995 [Gypsophila vaccaria]
MIILIGEGELIRKHMRRFSASMSRFGARHVRYMLHIAMLIAVMSMQLEVILKMILDAAGGIVVTNDGNTILRELDLAHPAAKSMIEFSRTQDEEMGAGTTSVIVLGYEFLK